MKSMRELISIMESVMPVTEIVSGAGGSDESDMQTTGTVGRDQAYSAFDAEQGQATEESIVEKSSSEKQARFMAACAHGADYDSCPSDSVSKEFNQADKGTKQLSSAMKDMEEGFAGAAAGGIAGAVVTKSLAGASLGSKLGSAAQDAMSGDSEITDEGVPAVNYCKQTNPASADVACAMEEGKMSDYFEQIMNRVYQLSDAFVDVDEAMEIIAKQMEEDGMSPEEIQQMVAAVQERIWSDEDSEIDDPMDGDFDSAMASAGHGSDEDYGDFPIDEARQSDINPDEVNALVSLPLDSAKARALEIITASTTSDAKKQYLVRQISNAKKTMDVVGLMFNMILAGEGNSVQGSGYSRKFGKGLEEAYDMNNGYRDVHTADKNDYFPDGADSPVVSDVGPSGARQGDNPEQKKMQIAETHKELVYAYRSFLKEAGSPKKDPNKNKYDHLGAGLGAVVDSDDHKKWQKEEDRIKKRKAAAKSKKK